MNMKPLLIHQIEEKRFSMVNSQFEGAGFH